MSWYVQAGKLLWAGVKAVAKHQGVQGAIGTVGTAVLMDKFVTKPKEERAKKGADDSAIRELKKKISELEKELRKKK